jgi:hypothetical protein
VEMAITKQSGLFEMMKNIHKQVYLLNKRKP